MVTPTYAYVATADSDGTTLVAPIAASRNLAASETNDLDALAAYLASLSQSNKQSKKKDADDQTAAIDLLMTYEQ